MRSFDLGTGNGEISRDDSTGEDVFFNFTAIPGEGYRTIRPGTPVQFEVVDGAMGPTARNIQKDETCGLRTDRRYSRNAPTRRQ